MIKGTRILIGDEAKKYTEALRLLEFRMLSAGYQEVILPNIIEQKVFVDKAGPEVLNQMYTFKDKGDRDICLVPEATAVIQQEYNKHWSKGMKKPVKVFYTQRCYRYEKPQSGRYREFTQFGVEYLGGDGREEVIALLKSCLNSFPLKYTMNDSVKRGLSYYIEEGFEAEVESLGAQKQIAGGGRYKEGVGWAIGIDRLILCY